MNIKSFIIILAVFLLFSSLVSSQESDRVGVTLTSCSDTDNGDDPSSPGTIEWGYAGADISGKGHEGTGKSGDLCSDLHYVNILLYAGEDIAWGDSILVEGVCPSLGTTTDQPGNLQVSKYYKCKCKNLGEGGAKGTENFIGICEDTPEEVPIQVVIDAENKWQQSGKNELNPKLVKFLNFFGLWG